MGKLVKMKKLLLLFLISSLGFASPQGVPVLTVATGLGSTSTQVLPVNLNRGYLIIQNETLGSCTVAPVPIVNGGGLVMLFGQNYETQAAFTKTAWYATCAVPGSSLTLLETNF